MEPFIVFCLALVFYCGFLTVIDLLKDQVVIPVAAKIKKKVTARPYIPGRLRVPAARVRTIGAFSQPRSGIGIATW